MDILSVLQFNTMQWPLAVMCMLRVISIFFFLPIFGDKVIPIRLKITLGLAFTFFIYPTVSEYVTQSGNLLQWSAVTLVIATLKELIFAFAVGFSAKVIIFACQIASHISGINMGFQTASMFSPDSPNNESAFASLQTWIIIVLLLILNVHHIFISNIIKSFIYVPIGMDVNVASLSKHVITVVCESFFIGLRLASPFIAIQILINISLGLLNRSLPSLNVFVISFPLSFLVSFILFFIAASSLVSFTINYGFYHEFISVNNVFKIFYINK